MSVVVLIGNSNAIEAVGETGGVTQFRRLDGDRITEFRFPDEATMSEVVTTVVSGLRYHLAGGEKPEWIYSGVQQLDHEIGRRFGFDPEADPDRFRRPLGWGRKATPAAPVVEAVTGLMAVHAALLLLLFLSLHIKTTAGVDLICRLLGDPNSSGSGLYAPAVYMGLTADTSPSAISDLVLQGEIEGESTLARAQAAYAHTNGTSSYTLTKAFVSDRSIVLARYGIFNAPSGGTLVFLGDIDPTASLNSGDPFVLTHTVTI